jgi:hypothetical protein
MENIPNNPDAPVTSAVLKAEFGKFEERLDKKLDKLFSEQTKATDQKIDGVKIDMEQLLADQADVILEAVGATMEKKLDEKFDPVITKLDGILKGVDALQQENTVGAKQLRSHEDQLQDHALRIKKLELSPSRLLKNYS